MHDLFSSPKKLQQMPKMYLDLLASRLGKSVVDINSMAGQMKAWSLKVQGFLTNRRTKVPIVKEAASAGEGKTGGGTEREGREVGEI